MGVPKRPLLCLALLCSLLSASAAGDTSDLRALTWLYPRDRSVVGGAGLIHIVGESPGPATIRIRLNHKALGEAKAKSGIYHYPLRLEFGLNRIELEIVQGAKPLGRHSREVFFFSPIAKEKEVPVGFTPQPFHRTGGTPEKCALCHTLEPQKTDLAPIPASSSSCHTCHRGLMQYKQVHGPAALWNCLACHNPASSPVRYSTSVPVRDLCYNCHTDQKEYFFSSRYQHGPTATGMCTICHNPHASDNEFWLKKPPWELCTTCHEDKASGRHIIAWGPSGDSHPTRGRPDPTKPEREFSCRSCHNPHASNSPNLWNFNATTGYQLCWVCHQK